MKFFDLIKENDGTELAGANLDIVKFNGLSTKTPAGQQALVGQPSWLKVIKEIRTAIIDSNLTKSFVKPLTPDDIANSRSKVGSIVSLTDDNGIEYSYDVNKRKLTRR
jgi:hypothetical protein